MNSTKEIKERIMMLLHQQQYFNNRKVQAKLLSHKINHKQIYSECVSEIK